MKIWRVFDDGNRAETVIEVGEEIGNSVIVSDFSKEDIFVESIVKTIEVEKIDGMLVGVINFCKLADT